MRQTIALWLLAGLAGCTLLPWYMTSGGFWSFEWVGDGTPDSALTQIVQVGRWWLIAPILAMLTVAIVQFGVVEPVRRAKLSLWIASAGLVLTALQGLVIVRAGPRLFEGLFGGEVAAAGQPGFGIGAGVALISLLFIATISLSQTGRGRGDAFVVSMIGLIVALVAVFVFYPVAHILIRAFEIPGGYSLTQFFPRFFDSGLWGLDCLFGGQSCGTAINSLFLALMTAAGTTILGLAFALIFTRTDFRAKKLLRVLTVIPIITPPFVIGLALILLFGRSGTVTEIAAELFGTEKTRWLYGFWGVYFAQLLSFTPIAFLVLIGVVQGVSPSMEEASQTLSADRWQTFRRVSLPLMRPGLANAFLLGFIESLADFGNPLVLGGGYNVLSTDIYFAIVGSAADPAKAAILAIALLSLTLSAFLAQRWWVGRKSYATITGKADSGQNAGLSPVVKAICYWIALPWAALTAVVYSMIIFGSFVKLWGYDHSFTFDHYTRAFGIDFTSGRLTGVAWDSYFTTLTISSIAAPLTALVGLATAYLLVRQKFVGKDAFEFSTMLSFAIPGTVIGVSYIMAFNFPPIELTGTSIILIVVFVFRNMPVGVRGGIAAMSQLDSSLDEASVTLGANSFTTVRRVILPLMGPALFAAITYSFVRAITSVSAVIFLVSAKHNMATSFIVGRVENGEFGIAIAYSAVLIVTMLTAILLLQLIIGTRRLRRTDRVQTAARA
ncbi:ABC transporter permease [Pontivivens insulae]|uniref:Sulfate transport system permease protein CysW n=1 Tax=Pontivivens insulae TaxID=1639689 RepID=A0A2R8A6P4_9RHOB|nr:iron ABC transporter permease [Pontivivens insulae]RED18006.1 iron(III) transport system permease protein [Pontivivens insulae]SPF27899.1 Sulfate transport system permease protein CysW [Pontivivens insulae]